jgi:peptide/nickel transport system substrate-binding protein
MRRIIAILISVLALAYVACSSSTAGPAATPTQRPPAAAQATPTARPAATATPQPAATAVGQQMPKEQPSVLIALSGEPKNLNPIFMDFHAGNWKFFNGLVSYDKDLNLVPDLAARLPAFSSDGRTLTVELRQGVSFHDGRPLSADDVVFTWRGLQDSNVASELRGRFDVVNVLQSVEATDSRTVRFTLKRPDPAFLHKLFVGIVPKHLLDGQDLNKAPFNQSPVGTGPYVFKEWRAGERVVMEANPSYFSQKANIQRVVFSFVGDETARAALVASASADAAGLPPKLAARFRNDQRYQVYEVPSADTRFAPLPNGNPILADPKVRRAIAMAINRKAIVGGVLEGFGEPAYGPFILGVPAPEIPYDLEAAQALLREAGWQKQSDGFFYKDGTKLAYTQMYPASDSLRKEVALAIRSDLAKLGIDVNVEGLGWDAITPRLNTDANVFGWGQPYDPDLELWELFHSSRADDDDPFSNAPKMRSSRVDKALEMGRAELDPQKRREVYAEFQKALQEDGTWLAVVQLKPAVVMSSKIKNVVIQREGHAHGFSRGVSWAMERWTLE